MPFVTIIGGFAMMTLGVALLLIGEVPFIAGRRISALRSRLIGVVLTCFLPLAIGVRFACAAIFGAEAAEGPVITSFVFSFCCLATLAILFRVLAPKRPPRPAAPKKDGPAQQNPFDAASAPTDDGPARGAPEPTPKPTSKKPPAKKSGNDPFDFS